MQSKLRYTFVAGLLASGFLVTIMTLNSFAQEQADNKKPADDSRIKTLELQISRLAARLAALESRSPTPYSSGYADGYRPSQGQPVYVAPQNLGYAVPTPQPVPSTSIEPGTSSAVGTIVAPTPYAYRPVPPVLPAQQNSSSPSSKERIPRLTEEAQSVTKKSAHESGAKAKAPAKQKSAKPRVRAKKDTVWTSFEVNGKRFFIVPEQDVERSIAEQE